MPPHQGGVSRSSTSGGWMPVWRSGADHVRRVNKYKVRAIELRRSVDIVTGEPTGGHLIRGTG